MDIVWGTIWIVGLIWILYLLRPRTRQLSSSSKARYRGELSSLGGLDPALGIINTDRILEQILWDLHGDNSLGENLKKYYSNHPRRDEIWKYHKLRNQVVHQGTPIKSFTTVTSYIELISGVFLD